MKKPFHLQHHFEKKHCIPSRRISFASVRARPPTSPLEAPAKLSSRLPSPTKLEKSLFYRLPRGNISILFGGKRKEGVGYHFFMRQNCSKDDFRQLNA
jgi:hypothetical protein